MNSSLHFVVIFSLIGLTLSCAGTKVKTENAILMAVLNKEAATISIIPEHGTEPLVVQNAKADFRPYLHPIMSPNGKASLTQYSPSHHRHQTGLYWGFTRINGAELEPDTILKWFYSRERTPEQNAMAGRDFFHHPDGDYWKRVDMKVIAATGPVVIWQTVYHMLDEAGESLLEESQTWSAQLHKGKILLDLEWRGKALQDVTIGKFDYGGMFLRMPWKRGIEGAATNSNGQVNQDAEGQAANWVNVAMAIEGLDQQGNITIMSHPKNGGSPMTWRVDGQLGVGPCRAVQGDWTIQKGDTEVIRHQLVAFAGDLNAEEMQGLWDEYAKE